MKVSLKDISKEKETLKYIQSVLRDQSVTKGLGNKLEKIIRFYEEVETDLEMCGESITELQGGRLEEIQERNRSMSFYNKTDDI